MEHLEDVYCSTTEFKAHLRHYKDLANSRFVYITEHGRATYVLVSIEVFEHRRAELCRQARWKVRAESACYRGSHPRPPLPDTQPQIAIEYLGQPWEAIVAPSFDNDIRRHELSDDNLSLVRQGLSRLATNPHAGLAIDVGPEACLPEGTRAYRLDIGGYDIIYGIDQNGELRVYGLIHGL